MTKTRRGVTDAFPFVDAHHHLWDLDLHRYPWLELDGDPQTTDWIGNYSNIRRSYLIDEYISEATPCGLYKSVHVQAGWGGKNTIGETKWLQNIANRYGVPNAIVAEVDLRSDNVTRQLESHAEFKNFRGARMLPMKGLVESKAFRRGFVALAKMRLSYDLNTRVPHMVEGYNLACGFPDTLIVVGNTGNPMERSKAYFTAWRKEMASLASAPNVVIKISGLGMSDHTWSIESIRPWILTAIELFGPSRVMFATNWPVDRLYSSYDSLLGAYHQLTDSFSDQERAEMFYHNAEKYYRI